MQIETERLTLREFVFDDWQVVAQYQNAPEYLRFYEWEFHGDADSKAFVQMFLNWQVEKPRTKYQLAITLKSGGQLIGNCGVRVNDPRLREANIGYELDHHYRGYGYATEAAQAILDFGFDELKMHRVWAHVIADNIASVHVLERLGLLLEAREREKEWIKDRWMDRLTYAMLDQEWRSKKDGR
jgi:ribosomal-protein-alanine N-acetyltransferase